MSTAAATHEQAQNHVVEEPSRSRCLAVFFVLSYPGVVLNLARFFPDDPSLLGWLFSVAVALSYAALYLAPVAALALLICGLAGRTRPGHVVARTVAVLGVTLVHLVLIVDRIVWNVMGFHLNGFVWNIVSTPGGLDSVGAGQTTSNTLALVALGVLLAHVTLLVSGSHFPVLPRTLTRRRLALLCVGLGLLGLAQMVAYLVADVRGDMRILRVADTVPSYVRVTAKHVARRLFGTKHVAGDQGPRMGIGDANTLRYPLAPLTLSPTRRRLNVLWLVAESLRADMVDPVVMPATETFARRSVWFRNHVSGGNGTRFGMFSMFYGIYGPYWFRFLQERRGPVLMDHLIADGYRLQAHTSASFTYPEFDHTIFASVPEDRFVTANPVQTTWQRDQAMVDKLLAFVDEDPETPFFAFEFFESPHARYQFPSDGVLHDDYLEDMDFARVDAARDIDGIKARYENSCHFLDRQFKRILDHLDQRGLLGSTIVVITGDHGEEFMEHGRWGHNSAFSHEQITPPLILSIPGVAAAERHDLTSHLDLPATVLRALGVTNLARDYSQGNDLLGPVRREWTVLADWWSVVYADEHDRIVCPMGARLDRAAILHEDVPVDAEAAGNAILMTKRDRLIELAKGLQTFSAPGR